MAARMWVRNWALRDASHTSSHRYLRRGCELCQVVSVLQFYCLTRSMFGLRQAILKIWHTTIRFSKSGTRLSDSQTLVHCYQTLKLWHTTIRFSKFGTLSDSQNLAHDYQILKLWYTAIRLSNFGTRLSDSQNLAHYQILKIWHTTIRFSKFGTRLSESKIWHATIIFSKFGTRLSESQNLAQNCHFVMICSHTPLTTKFAWYRASAAK